MSLNGFERREKAYCSTATKGTRMGMLRPANLLFLEVPESDFADFLSKTDEFIDRYPEILDAIEADLDAHGKEEKKGRLEDKRWEKGQCSGSLPGMEPQWQEIRAEDLTLLQGRPRMPAAVVFMFMMIRAYAGGAASRDARDLVCESMTVHLILQCHDMGVPGISTVNDNLNAVSNQTRRMIHKKQVRYAKAEDLDDFREMTVDSSAVRANTAWPTDSAIILKLLERVWRTGSRLEEYGTSNFERHWTEWWLKAMRSENLAIVMSDGRRERKKHYGRFLDCAEKAARHLEGQRQALEGRVKPRRIRPTLRRRLEQDRNQLRRDLEDARKMIDVARRRIFEDEQTPASERVLSIADRDLAFITKGDRDPIVGYRPQICRSANGFVGYLEVPEGNAADSGRLLPALRGWKLITGVIPTLLSTDDGYTSNDGKEEAEEMGVETVSFSGSKGRKLLGHWEWWDEERMRAREERSAVESLVFTLKYCYGFGRVSRRGIEAVRAELLEDAIAHNFFRMVQIERGRENDKIPQAA